MNMYSRNPSKDLLFFTKALITNFIAKWLPDIYIKLTKDVGRKDRNQDIETIAAYFKNVFYEYFSILNVPYHRIGNFLEGKSILEYGPGDLLAVALMMYAYGAEEIYCVDKFQLSRDPHKNAKLYNNILQSLSGACLERASQAYNKFNDSEGRLNTNKIKYYITPNGLSGMQNKFDLIISRAVLEHVNDLEGTFQDMKNASKKDGLIVHKVDLKSHDLDRYLDLDFLTWPQTFYNLMYCNKGVPNRWRINKYKELILKYEFKCIKLIPTSTLSPKKVNAIYPHLDTKFKKISKDELGCLGFWMVLKNSPN